MKSKPFVFLDLGGTLIDLRGIVASMAARLETIHVRGPVPLALLWAKGTAELLPHAQGPRFRPERDIAADVLCALLEKRGRVDARDESMRLVREAWAGFVGTCALQADTSTDWLRGLRSRVSGLGLVTDGDTEAVTAVLAHLRLSDLFDSVTISEEARSYKPDPRIYRAGLKALQANPSSSLFVSDATLDLQGAAKLGMATALIPRGLLPDLAEPPKRTAVLADLRGVDRIVRGYARLGRFRLR